MNHDKLNFWLILLLFPLLFLLLWAVSVCLFPALIGVSLVTVHQSWFADHSSTQR